MAGVLLAALLGLAAVALVVGVVIDRRSRRAAPPSAPKTRRLKDPTPKGRGYVEACFNFPFREEKETRTADDVPGAMDIGSAGNEGRVDEGLRLAEALRASHPDFFFSYVWLGLLNSRRSDLDSARDALLDGLRHSRSKYSICRALADIERDAGDLGEAVRWWTRAVVLQMQIGDGCNDAPFLYLSHVAEALGLFRECQTLRQYMQRIGPGYPLSPQAAARLHGLTHQQGSRHIRQALTRLCDALAEAAQGRKPADFTPHSNSRR